MNELLYWLLPVKLLISGCNESNFGGGEESYRIFSIQALTRDFQIIGVFLFKRRINKL
jgi:hypothetical protein